MLCTGKAVMETQTEIIIDYRLRGSPTYRRVVHNDIGFVILMLRELTCFNASTQSFVFTALIWKPSTAAKFSTSVPSRPSAEEQNNLRPPRGSRWMF